MRLSDKQKEVITLMRKGWELSRISIKQNGVIRTPKGRKGIGIKYSTISALKRKGLLTFRHIPGSFIDSWIEYYLTDKAKTINLNH